ncbi:MAG: class I SAM-dependent methyltransferase [Candidatus Krumholzibacteria bacterium]|nr:class I SAM-dependent methyltransferase [Candidatus Krumholzibacteria bacterium]MDH4335655.1 class I SAM-dependent methyltransferase [Candidatus Krumholzibacteria bacterium]MDH5270450.1 class I SAM-dependent methyltransferase [Candidatus Krumholzibacteria bacterium]
MQEGPIVIRFRRNAVVLALALLSLATLTAVSPAQDNHGSGDHQHNDDATIEHRFNDADAWAERFESPARDAWQLPDSVVATLATRKDMRIADIGSATGYFPVRFARACPDGFVIGADIEPGMIQYLNDRARREGLANLVSVLAAPDDPHLPMPVDLVFICDTYHHINNRVDYFTRLKEQLRPGGRVAIVDFRPASSLGPPHKLAPEVVESEMKNAGFDIAERHDFLPEQYLLVFVVASRD